jgi:signal transduction histidine kinase/CheY-like chemotaxis protein/AraC-like DNA-binding protein
LNDSLDNFVNPLHLSHTQHVYKYILIISGLVLINHSLSSQGLSLGELKRQLEIHAKDDTAKVVILNELSSQYQYLDFHQSLDYAEQAVKMATQLSFKKGIATANYRKAYCYWTLGYYELSIEKALEAVDIAEKEHYIAILAEGFRVLAMSYRDQQDVNKASNYIGSAEKLSLQIKDWDLLSRVYNTGGLIQYDKHKYDSSFQLFNRAFLITKEHNTSQFQVCQILSNIGECYLENNPDLGLEYFTKALTKAKEIKNRQAEAGILSDVGRALARKKRYTEADEYLQAGLKLARQLGLRRVIRYTYLALVDLKEREGKSAEALSYTKNYYEMRDSLLNSAKTRQIVELETRHETEKKEQAIKILEQEKKIELIWRNALIMGSLILLLASIIIYRLQQLRNHKARQLISTQKALNEKLKETDQLKSRFFANISHELRTPLSLISAPIEGMIKSTSVPATNKDDLRMVKRNADRLLDLVNQLLDLSKLEAKKMELHLKDGDLNEFLKTVVASFDSLAENKKIHFFKNISTPNQNVAFDADKLEKIITNILFNAFKFTPQGGAVTLSIYTGLESSDLNIKITDTGKGISVEDQSHLFSPFYQSKETSDDGELGTGLGLALVHELVKLYKGELRLTSQVGHGTTLSISVPLHQSSDTTQASFRLQSTNTQIFHPVEENLVEQKISDQETINSDSILIVEDNPDLRNFIATSFKDQFKIFTAKNGEEGLALAFEHIPDLVISDVMMPVMDGMVLTDKIKLDERTSHIPVVLLTAKVDSQSRIEGLKTGADDYLAKPFSIEELQVRVKNLIEQRKKLVAKFRATVFIEEKRELIKPSTPPTLDEKFMLKAKEVVEKNLSDPLFGVEKFAEEMNLGRTQLFRKFKALIDTSPSEFINDLRLERAANLIRSKSDTLAQICYSVGFNEQSYFAKRFRKKYGVSPSEYVNLES